MSRYLYERVKSELRRRIAHGDYGPGHRVPSESELVEAFGVSTITVRRAIRELIAEGLLIGRQGLGVFVADNRRIVRDLLTNAGYELIEAVTGEDGLRFAETHRPDLILMDIQLPGIDGYEVTRRLRQNRALARTPIIAVTSYALSGDDAKALAAGCDAYIAKPFSPRALLAKVRECLAPS